MDKHAFRTSRGRTCEDKVYSLSIKADDGRTLFETRVEQMHQAFQQLIDWSIGDGGYNGWATISGPNGFLTNQRIEGSDFAWIENCQC
jgi:hypothetical protein